MNGERKTTITISAKVRAAYAALQADSPGLTLSDFYEQAVTFYLAYRDEASFRPLVKHLSTITQQLDTLRQQLQTVVHPPPVNHDRLAQLVTNHVVDELTKVPSPWSYPGGEAGSSVGGNDGIVISPISQRRQGHTEDLDSASPGVRGGTHTPRAETV